MIFNKILIPQDSFTKTNVTRKRVRRRKFVITFKSYFLFKISHFVFIHFFLENMENNNNITWHAGMMYENKVLEK